MHTSSVITLTGATLVTGFLGYAVYFDYKRRNDPAFRSQLKKDRKRTSKELKKQGERKKKDVSAAIEKTVHELSQPGAIPAGVAEKEEVFMQSVQEGELLITKGAEYYINAASAFFRALKVYPKPMELLLIYEKAVPPEALAYIYEMVAKDSALNVAQAAGSANLEEIDDASPRGLEEAENTVAPAISTSSPPSAPVSSQGEESGTGSTTNGDASSQEWEKVDRDANAGAEEVVEATDNHLNQVGEAILQEAERMPEQEPSESASESAAPAPIDG